MSYNDNDCYNEYGSVVMVGIKLTQIDIVFLVMVGICEREVPLYFIDKEYRCKAIKFPNFTMAITWIFPVKFFFEWTYILKSA